MHKIILLFPKIKGEYKTNGLSIVSNGQISKFFVAEAYFGHQYTLIKSSIALLLLPFPVSSSEIIESLFIGSTV